MEVELVNITDKEVELNIKDEDISILYILQHELLKDKNVKFAGFSLKHPLTLEYYFRVVADEPLEAILKAIKKAKTNVKELESSIKKVVDK